MKTCVKVICAAAVLSFGGLAAAQTGVPGPKANTEYSDGEVRRVDKAAGKLTLRHGTIANLEMSPMTMVFRVKEASMLERLKEGDKIRFKAEKIQGAITVTEIQPAP